MREPQCLTTLLVSTACYKESFTFTLYIAGILHRSEFSLLTAKNLCQAILHCWFLSAFSLYVLWQTCVSKSFVISSTGDAVWYY
jgi:hypothetical protein